MRIFIPGGNGCLGYNLTNYLLEKDNKVCILDNYETSNPKGKINHQNLISIEGSITDEVQLKNLFESFKPTHVINCAASYKNPNDLNKDVEVNINGMINLIEVSKAFKIKKFINFQTSLCYGDPYILPIPINHYLNPKSSYGISKTAGELFLINSELNYLSFRLASVLAPRLFVGVIPNFYKRLKVGDECFCSDSIRDFISINDFLSLIDISLEDDSPKGIFNVSNGIGVSIKKLHDEIANLLNVDLIKEPPILAIGPDDIREVVLDPSHTRKLLGWEAKENIRDSLSNLINWYESNGLDSVYSHVLKIKKN
ncbi:NAD-dependent epimerase/dehydratase family protein [uncultured Prochlorococcus sp.]|uniref:NAD-dependent epimerase/dehydratase family protein n=1 Tax=uncultured Prochlorococcus sp. TaxID=159733 RepID=UPI0025855CE7|nr:NAD-dependent epimerase/dehydratase family protein [uncultured Prochlorococcus sp.]